MTKKSHKGAASGGRGGHKKDAAVRRELRKSRRGTGPRHSDKEATAFNSQLAIEGLTIYPIAGDGNCLFRAIAHQVFGNEERHMEVRLACVSEMERHPDDYAPFLLEEEGWEGPGAFAEYCKAMSSPREWGGNLEVIACGRSLSRHVVIHRLGEPRWEVVAPGARATIHISYHNGDHYASVRGIATGDKEVATPQLRITTPSDNDRHTRGAASSAACALAASECERVASVCDMVWPHTAEPCSAPLASAALSECYNDVESAVGLLLTGWRPQGAGEADDSCVSGCAASPSPVAAATPASAVAASTLPCRRAAAASSGADTAHPRRNGPCPCGSTLAYRRCCMGVDAAARTKAAAALGAAAAAAALPDSGRASHGDTKKARGGGRPDYPLESATDADSATSALAAVRI